MSKGNHHPCGMAVFGSEPEHKQDLLGLGSGVRLFVGQEIQPLVSNHLRPSTHSRLALRG